MELLGGLFSDSVGFWSVFTILGLLAIPTVILFFIIRSMKSH